MWKGEDLNLASYRVHVIKFLVVWKHLDALKCIELLNFDDTNGDFNH